MREVQKVPSLTSPPPKLELETRNRNSERKVDGTTDQYYWFILSVVDALRLDRDRGGVARTMAFCPGGTRSLCRSAAAYLLEPCRSRYSRTLGGLFQGVTL